MSEAAGLKTAGKKMKKVKNQTTTKKISKKLRVINKMLSNKKQHLGRISMYYVKNFEESEI